MEGLPPLLDVLRDLYWEDMDTRERRHQEEMAAQKEALAKVVEIQKAEVVAVKEALAEQLGALVVCLTNELNQP